MLNIPAQERDIQDPDDARGYWIQTYTGRRFYLADPRPEDFNIEDIATALSRVCRFSGHCLQFMSVAEHSVMVMQEVMRETNDPRILRAAILHDGPEAYVGDNTRPLKAIIPQHVTVENRILEAMAKRYDFDVPLDPRIKRADNAVAYTEVLTNMRKGPLAEEWSVLRASQNNPKFLMPDHARIAFLVALEACGINTIA